MVVKTETESDDWTPFVAGGSKEGTHEATDQPLSPLIIQRQQRTFGLSGQARPQALDQLTGLTANSADDRASPLLAT